MLSDWIPLHGTVGSCYSYAAHIYCLNTLALYHTSIVMKVFRLTVMASTKDRESHDSERAAILMYALAVDSEHDQAQQSDLIKAT